MDAIRRDRVLLIANSDNAQSVADAADYTTRRGLTGGHTLTFAFGTVGHTTFNTLWAAGPLCTTPGPYNGMRLLLACAAYIAANGIDAVILSTYTTYYVLMPGTSAIATMGSFVASSPNYVATAGALPYYFDRANYDATSHDSVASIQANVCHNWRRGSPRNPGGFIPHGRLGCPDVANSTIAETPLRNTIAGASVYDRAVTVALAAESQDQTLQPYVGTDTANVSTFVTAAENLIGLSWARQLAMSNLKNLTASDFVTTEGGSLTGVSSIWGICCGAGFNVSPWTVGGPLADSFTCPDGAWGYLYISYSYCLGSDMLYNGAAAAGITYGEPLAPNIPQPQELFIHATTHQIPLMLAHFLAHSTNQGSTVCGDPLYTPYLNTGVVPPKPICLPHG